MNDDLAARDLENLGDALQAAVGRTIARRNTASSGGHESDMDQLIPDSIPFDTAIAAKGRGRRRTRRIAILSAVAILGVGGAAAATAVHLSGDDVSHGLPGGSLLFTGTNPSCSSSDGVVFQCTLASKPTLDVEDDYTGSAQTFVDSTLHVAGGCRGQSADGLKWTCYVGQRAVDEQIISSDFLGQYEPAPGQG